MYINLVERIHEASDLKTHEAYYDNRILETLPNNKKNREKLHIKRLKGLTEGRTISVILTTVHPNDPRYGQNRSIRRWRNRLIQRMLKHVRMPTEKQQKQVDKEVNKLFSDKEERRKSGLIIPKGRVK